ncbi:hypothetical protein [Rufibacter immobilis]|uniref:hypothetical protein n=1 Tax=Rufibacter immobilis TaxID=1348778 RepID=UPI0011CDDD35|nr:hypothetical protein [Rufibacter immobilis]
MLLLFCQVMVPEAAILALHDHEHTAAHDEPAPGDAKHTVGKVHKHCKEKDYGQPHLLELPTVPTPVYTVAISSLTTDFCFAWKFTYPNNIDLRGPPQLLS